MCFYILCRESNHLTMNFDRIILSLRQNAKEMIFKLWKLQKKIPKKNNQKKIYDSKFEREKTDRREWSVVHRVKMCIGAVLGWMKTNNWCASATHEQNKNTNFFPVPISFDCIETKKFKIEWSETQKKTKENRIKKRHRCLFNSWLSHLRIQTAQWNECGVK